MADNRAYTNVMERLVAEEVERQKAKLPPKLREYIKTVEVETFALNRLPALYASSEKGWQMQYEKAGKTHAKAVSNLGPKQPHGWQRSRPMARPQRP